MTRLIPGVIIGAIIVVGAAVNVLTLSAFGRATPVSLLAGFVVSAVVIAVVWALMRRSVLWRPAGAWPLLPLAWGAFGSFAFILAAGESLTTIATALGWEAAEASLGGAWPEEVGKSFGIALILLALPCLWNRPWDGLLVGVFVGLGFEFIETVQYGAAGALEDANSDVDGLLTMWFIRAIAGPGLHVFFSAVAGLGIGLALLHPRLSTSRRWLYGLGGPTLAFLMHFAWNYDWAGGWAYAVMWPLYLGALIACWIAARRMV